VSWEMAFSLMIIIMLTLLLGGQWIAFALACTSVFGLLMINQIGTINILSQIAWSSTCSFTLIAIPQFLFMGELILRGGFSEKFYHGATKWLGRMPGGLLQSNILSCSFFAAISGSSAATAAAISTVAVPELTKRGYDKSMISGSLGAGGCLGVLIPPSLGMIVFGSLVNVSVARLFIAGIIPGIVTVIIMMMYITLRVSTKKGLVPPGEMKKYSILEKIKSLKDMYPFFVIILIIIGGIYLGITTPTEAAAISTTVAFIFTIVFKTFSWKMLIDSIKSAVKNTCMVMYVIVGAQVLSFFMVKSGIGRSMAQLIVDIDPSPILFIMVLTIIFVILGCLVDVLSMVFLTIPILWPMIVTMGFNEIWIGIWVIIMCEIAQITPPLGLNLFVLQGVSKFPIGTVIKGHVPYFIIFFITSLLIIIFPQLVLWLPSKMF